MKELMDAGELKEVLGAELAIIFKHSTQCPISANAYREVERFLEIHAHAPIYLVKVIESRQLSDTVGALTGIRHESPQVIILQHGAPVWHESHYAITAAELERALVDFQ